MSTTDHHLPINTLRFLAVDAVQKANSGHPGMPMGAAATAYAVWTRQLKFDPSAPEWADRDRFVLSAGHGSMLIYALLHMARNLSHPHRCRAPAPLPASMQPSCAVSGRLRPLHPSRRLSPLP